MAGVTIHIPQNQGSRVPAYHPHAAIRPSCIPILLWSPYTSPQESGSRHGWAAQPAAELARAARPGCNAADVKRG
ncbi:hypothetical protein HaLaN_29071 [Haematococcus lacustris]|uniref:Uncharacterized protein n=1 Tax=Haematococcus lacustris TaxID=44745 RepID=A0A6A0ADT0_HAELA|nr:hypothetical protein HaLaN_29071 [Haematococcus lacustris]